MVLASHDGGITSGQVTTVATVALAVLTLIYVVLTYLLAKEARRSSNVAEKTAKEARRSSNAAKKAATAASKAATAAARSAAVAEAGFDVEFSLSASVYATGIFLTLKSSSQIIYVFKVVLLAGYLGLTKTRGAYLDSSFEVTPRDPLPCLLTRGQGVDFDINFGSIDPANPRIWPTSAKLMCEIRYGFDPNYPEATWTTRSECEWEMLALEGRRGP